MIDRHTQLEAFRKSMGESERHALSDVPFGYPRKPSGLEALFDGGMPKRHASARQKRQWAKNTMHYPPIRNE